MIICMTKKITLTWPSGVWKTLIWGELGKSLAIPCYDGDAETLKRLMWMTIPNVIDKVGMDIFRAREAEGTTLAIQRYKEDHILSLGWWTLTEHAFYNHNMSALKSAWYLIIYIKTDIEIILERMKDDSEWNNKRVDLDEQEFRERYETRDPWYTKSSWLVVPNNGTPNETVDAILEHLSL